MGLNDRKRRLVAKLAIFLLISSFVVGLLPPMAFAEEITNGGFESDWTGWTHSGGDISTSEYYSGAKSAHVSYSENFYQDLAVSINAITSFTVYAKKDAGSGNTYIAYQHDGGEDNFLLFSGTSDAVDWTQVDILAEMTSDGAYGTLDRVTVTRMSDNFVDFWFDVFSLETGDAPFYSNVGNGAVNNGYAVNCYSYWTVGTGDLDGFYFEHNATGTPTNQTWASFSATNNAWANATINLDGTLGDVVQYRTYANSSLDIWNATDPAYFTVSATVTFYHNTGGSFRRDGYTVSNGTETTYSSPTTLVFTNAPVGGYEFDYYSWYAGTETDDTTSINWGVNWTTAVWCYFTESSAPTPPPFEPPIIPDDDTVEVELYWQWYTQTVNNATGYAAAENLPDDDTYEPESFDFDIEGNATFTLGWRIYAQYESFVTELTDGTPVAQGSVDWTDNEQEVELSNTYNLDETDIAFGVTALKFVLYYRWNETGAWSPAVIFITDYLHYPSIAESTITISMWAYYAWDEEEGYTLIDIWYDGDEYLAGVDGLYFNTATGTDYQGYYLGQGDFLGFITIPYTVIIGNLFYALILLGIGFSIYIRYKSFTMLVLFITILGGSGGVIQLVIGDLFMGVVWIVAAFGLALAYWRLFR